MVQPEIPRRGIARAARSAVLAPALAVLLLAATVSALAGPARAEERTAYANMELILSLMPEMDAAMGKLDVFERELTRQLDVKRSYAQQKLSEAQQAAAGGAAETELSEYRKTLQGLEREIQQLASDSADRMNEKRSELMDPVVAKLQGTIADIAKREGYTWVLNSVDGAGNSIVLFGPEERNLTRMIIQELGIDVPEADEPPAQD